MTEVDLRINLARAADNRRADHLWRGFLAATRAVALNASDSQRWSKLADIAQELRCFNAAGAVAGHAKAIGGQAEAASHVRALASAGRIDEAIRSIGGATDPWSECARGYLLLRQGRRREAVRLLSAVAIDPSWTWAQYTLLSALLLTGRAEQAAAEAESFADAISDRADEYAFLSALAHFELIQGHSDRAVELAERLLEVQEEREAAAILGQALVLRGDVDRGLEVLGEGLSSYLIRSLDDWESVERPQLQALAQWRGIELGGLEALEPLVIQRRQQLEALSDPVAELAQASAAHSEPSVVAPAKALGRVLLHLAQADETAAVHALAEVGSELSAETAALDDHLRDLANRRRQEGIAAEVVECSALGDRAGASKLLAQLLEDVPYRVDDLLRKQASPDELRPVARVLTDLAKDHRYQRSARAVLEWLDMGELAPDIDVPHPDLALQLRLPRSWFEEHADPVRDHALFLRYIRELRLQLSWELPPVRVSVDDSLEPDGYQILSEGELLNQGRIDPSDRYCSDATVQFLPASLRPFVRRDEVLGMSRIAAEAVLVDALAEQLTMPAVEVVARLVGTVATNAVGPGAEAG